MRVMSVRGSSDRGERSPPTPPVSDNPIRHGQRAFGRSTPAAPSHRVSIATRASGLIKTRCSKLFFFSRRRSTRPVSFGGINRRINHGRRAYRRYSSAAAGLRTVTPARSGSHTSSYSFGVLYICLFVRLPVCLSVCL